MEGHTNALTETTISLYKTECVHADSLFRHSPIRILTDLALNLLPAGR